jgi:hypothetical protein
MNDVSAAQPVSSPRASTPSWQLGAYIVILLAAVIAGTYYRLRNDTIFACQAGGYSGERYLSYCQSDGYGDFDHGAFWFNLEPAATHSASRADVLFIGNSRMEYGFSSEVSQQWLARNASPYFLLGFAYHPRVLFQGALVRRLNPRARVYVINLDSFFEENASVPARTVMEDPSAAGHYRYKQLWQLLHRAVCGSLTRLCGNSYAIFKDRRTGVWEASGRIAANEATSDEATVDADAVERETRSGQKFLDSLRVDRRCVIFTLVPTVDTPSLTSAAIANALHVDFIAPKVEDLLTFDGSHLDGPSAERWSAAFFDAAGGRIRQCLSDRPAATLAAGK